MFGSGDNEVIFVLFFKKCSVSVLYFSFGNDLCSTSDNVAALG